MTSKAEYRKYLAQHFTPEKQEIIIEFVEAAPAFLRGIEKLTPQDFKLMLEGLG